MIEDATVSTLAPAVAKPLSAQNPEHMSHAHMPSAHAFMAL